MATLIKDSLYIGESPWDESCAQLGSDMYMPNARKECARFIQQIRNHYGAEPEGARLYIKQNPHDFGTYLSVECMFMWDPADEEAEYTVSQDYAFAIEEDYKRVLQNWDSDV